MEDRSKWAEGLWQRTAGKLFGRGREKAKQAEDAKKQLDFIAAMAHEMRTQINAILGTDELILRDYDDPALRKYAGTIRTSAVVLSSMVNDVLDYTKLNSGKANLVLSEYRLSTLLIEVVNVVWPDLIKKELKLKTEVDGMIPSMLRGDSFRLKQCVLNILTNAVKYTERGEIRIKVTYEPVGENGSVTPVSDTLTAKSATAMSRIRLKITISDTGVGMTGEDLTKLFSPFERSEQAIRKQIEGSGLGMSIVQKNLEMMGGKVEVHSEYGVGSSFVITLEQEVAEASPLGDFEKQLESALDLKTKDIHFKAHGVRILAVDDTEINLNILVRLLRDTGVTVDTASSGEEGLKKTRESTYDMLLIDHLMPKMDGVEMLKELRCEDKNPNSKAVCIALSGNGVESDLAEYRRAGFDDYLAKPVVSAKLYLMLAKYLPKEKVDPQ